MLTRRSVSLGRARIAIASAEPAFAPPFPLIPRPAPGVERRYTPVRAATPRSDPLPAIALLGPLKIAATKPRRRRLRSQTQELLAYLALHKEGATTDELVALLWPDVDIDNARARAHRAVSEARSQLGKVIVRAGERYVLDRNSVAVDLDKFEALLARADARGDVDREQLLEKALGYVRGEPLGGTDYSWAAGEVRHLRARLVDLLHDLGNLRLDKENAAGALAAAEQALALDAYNESAHRLAMRAESALRLREAIVARYERLHQELDAQFGLEPERETRLLYRHLLGQDAGSASAAV
jgi:DNA-binding SARP family transcriptional activator